MSVQILFHYSQQNLLQEHQTNVMQICPSMLWQNYSRRSCFSKIGTSATISTTWATTGLPFSHLISPWVQDTGQIITQMRSFCAFSDLCGANIHSLTKRELRSLAVCGQTVFLPTWMLPMRMWRRMLFCFSKVKQCNIWKCAFKFVMKKSGIYRWVVDVSIL